MKYGLAILSVMALLVVGLVGFNHPRPMDCAGDCVESCSDDCPNDSECYQKCLNRCIEGCNLPDVPDPPSPSPGDNSRGRSNPFGDTKESTHTRIH